MSVLNNIATLCRTARPHIVLSEGEDPRVAEAAVRAGAEGLARITLLGATDRVRRGIAGAAGQAEIDVLDPEASDRIEDYATAYHALRRHKGVDMVEARKVMRSPLGFAAMMLRQGDADGTIGGAVATTAETVRTALQIVGKAETADVVSSCFLMLLGAPFSRPVIFADCGLILQPTAVELASIAIASAGSLTALTGQTPRIAMLSFSTLGSVPDTAHESIGRINTAVRLVRDRRPDLMIEGEIQFDAALMPDVASSKAPASILGGNANVFVFPSLSAGNIGYKIAQRLGGAMALGPIIQGLARPANDLSRGCSVDDVYRMIAITGAQSAAMKRIAA
ncbi:phosphate acetyltransferase [Tropicimonas sp. IMCC34043]|uniref:phosphate acetyltransferase n=1 Tax=Tropicimonas sp. IMCC34043 TaxID=2248760 RepID=UPI000E250067|nr:phosphate acetyltransferase [Tropicimonas sp. IMCC34043]